ncbi:MAG: hypothetical protein M3082_05605 [Candidatus Dormibacteraeota bacterium]|nr:hypothetical protein [Candidatus Dormibacteraeota bacterium]
MARTLAVLVTVMGAMTTALAPADASVFLGILSAGKPASPAFVFSPDFMTMRPSGATITFTINVKNLTSEPQTVTLKFNVHHILTYYGLNVADGQPGQPGITFKPGDAPNTTQQLVGTPQLVTVSFPPAAAGPKTLTFQQTVNVPGYFQVDVGQHKTATQPQANLSAGFTRVLDHTRAQPSISTTANPKSATVGATLKDSATLSGGQSPTGTITFTLLDPKHAVAHTEIVHVTGGNGTYSTSTGDIASTAGTWQWKAEYSGDASNMPVASNAADEPVTVIPTGGVGAVLADTGSTPPAEVLAMLLIGFGGLAIMTAVAWRRRPS